jgi:hypothetical protein
MRERVIHFAVDVLRDHAGIAFQPDGLSRHQGAPSVGCKVGSYGFNVKV